MTSSSNLLRIGCFITGFTILLVSICAQHGFASRLLLLVMALFLTLLPVIQLWELSKRVAKGRIHLFQVIGAILIWGGFLFFFGNPSERLTANNDQGIYGLTAFNILHTGSSKIALPDELSPELLNRLATSQPMQAIRSDTDPGRHAFYMDMPLYTDTHPYLLSQFPEAFPTSMAALGSLIGARNMIWINWLWLFLLSGVAAIIGERLGGRIVGIVFFLSTLVLPLHIWAANRLFSELMLSVCVGFTILGIEWSLKSDEKILPLSIASVWCSLAIMTKIEGVLVVAVFICFVVFFIWKQREARYLIFVMLPFVILVQSVSIYQLESLFSSLKNLWLPVLIVLFLAPTAFYALKSLNIRISTKQSHPLFFTAVIGMVLLFCFFYFAYPILMKGDTFYYWPKGRNILSLRG